MHISIARYAVLAIMLVGFSGCKSGPSLAWWKKEKPKTTSSYAATSNPYAPDVTMPSATAAGDYNNAYQAGGSYPVGGSYPASPAAHAAAGTQVGSPYGATAGVTQPGYTAGGAQPTAYSAGPTASGAGPAAYSAGPTAYTASTGGANAYGGNVGGYTSPAGNYRTAGPSTAYPAGGGTSYPGNYSASTNPNPSGAGVGGTSSAYPYPNAGGSYPNTPASYDGGSGTNNTGAGSYPATVYPSTGYPATDYRSGGSTESSYPAGASNNNAGTTYGATAQGGGDSSLGDRYSNSSARDAYQGGTGYQAPTSTGYNEASAASAASVQGFAPGSVTRYPDGTDGSIAPASYNNQGPAASTSALPDYESNRYR